jgi:Xaa-Pro aminopeptidase
MPSNPPEHIAARWERLREQMRRHRLDAFLATAEADVGYLGGFGAEHSWLLVTPQAVRLLTDGRYAEEIEAEGPWVEPVYRGGPMPEAAAELTVACGARRVGFDPMALDAYAFGVLRKHTVGRGELIPRPQLAAALRAVKDAVEVAAIRRAVGIAESAFRAVRTEIRVGMSEREIAARLEYHMRLAGAERPAFPTIAATGPNGSRPHARAGERRLGPGEPLLLDWGACAEGYNSDLTRLTYVDKLPPSLRDAAEAVSQARRAALAVIGPGASTREIDAAARRVIERTGHGAGFAHGLGHGLGRELHEWPSLTWHEEADRPLEPGNVITVEPGVYLPGIGGVRIEDDVLVTETGCELLSTLDTDPADLRLG